MYAYFGYCLSTELKKPSHCHNMPSLVQESEYIPVIDVSEFLADPRSIEACAVVDQIRQACATSGFFQMVNHGLHTELQDGAFAAAENFFRLPMQEKTALDASKNSGHRGYDVLESQSYEEGVMPDLKEVTLTS
jgi:isopenicillin N synthase-like dioxygenase